MKKKLMSGAQFKPVDTRPVKRFFVEMLTRDIALEDAVLDLLDNCVDGVLRSIDETKKTAKPYKGYWAKISFNENEFVIEDNCGGIPWSLHNRAFRMGRPLADTLEDQRPTLTVGVYGIGMKRAIFKMGRSATIETQSEEDAYEVSIPKGWMAKPDDWNLDVAPMASRNREDGTKIVVKDLENSIRDRFKAEAFQEDLLDKIESHYAIIIDKGLKVTVNKIEAQPKPLSFRFAAEGEAEIRPYVFKASPDGVDVFVAVGLRDPIPGVEVTLEAQSETPYSSDFAGWTVICNDRIVLYCNRDELTGWGTAKIPRYHTQFIAISGVVEFKGNPSLLPTTTTKRGLDFASALYQQVLDRMRDGLRVFIDFTNRWKTHAEEAKAFVAPVASVTFDSLRRAAETLPYAKVRVGLPGEQYKPDLPRPKQDSPDVRITYFRDREDVETIAEHLLNDVAEMRERDVRRQVGEKSFDYAFSELVTGKRGKKKS